VRDIRVVAGKELREIVGAGGGRRGLVRELLFVGIFGLFFPLSQAEVWRTGSVPAVFALMIPLFLVGPHVADSFAGEKERGTLETLLATRLPDRSIYLGKIFAVVGYAWVVTLFRVWNPGRRRIRVCSCIPNSCGRHGRLDPTPRACCLPRSGPSFRSDRRRYGQLTRR